MAYRPNLRQNELLVELLAKNAEDAIVYKGYIGPDKGEEHILLYPDIADLSKCFEIKISDIITHAEAPKSILPFGGVILWLKKDSEVISRHTVGKSDSAGLSDKIQTINDEVVQIHAGRLTMTIEKANIVVGNIPHPCKTVD